MKGLSIICKELQADKENLEKERDEFRAAAWRALSILQNDMYKDRVRNAVTELESVLDEYGYPEGDSE